MKALVTGGGGFLGKEVVRQLLEKGYRVRTFSRSEYPELEALGAEQTKGDLANFDDVLKAVAGCDLVFHVGSKVGPWGFYDDFYRANVTGTENVIKACRLSGIGKLIYTSSPSVVFNGQDMEDVDETVPYSGHFEASYPKTKALAEKAVLAANGPSLATVALRPHLIFGPGDKYLVPAIIEKSRTKKLRLIGKGQNKIDTVHVYNAAQAHILAAEHLKPESRNAGKAYFISNDDPKPIRYFFERVIEIHGLPPLRRNVPFFLAYAAGWFLEKVYHLLKVEEEPLITRFIARELSTAHWFNISAAKKDFGYAPHISVEEGLNQLHRTVVEPPPASETYCMQSEPVKAG